MIDSGFHDVLAQAKKLLSESPFDPIRRLDILRDGDEIRLQGHVPSFYFKQLAQETIRTATRGMQLVNHVEVD